MLEVVESILAGAIVGGVLTLYLRFVKRELVVFAVVLVFATAAAAEALHFELLLSLLVAGFLVENVAPVRAEPLVETLHQMAVPVFVVFFAIAGAELHVREFAALWPLVLTIALLRMGAIAVGATAGGRLAGAEPQVTKYAWTGLVSQAGRGPGARDHRGRPAAGGGSGHADADRRGHRLQRVGGPGALSARPGPGGGNRGAVRGLRACFTPVRLAVPRADRSSLVSWRSRDGYSAAG